MLNEAGTELISEENVPYTEDRVKLKAATKHGHDPVDYHHLEVNVIGSQNVPCLWTQFLYFFRDPVAGRLYDCLVEGEKVVDEAAIEHSDHGHKGLVLAVQLQQQEGGDLGHTLDIAEV